MNLKNILLQTVQKKLIITINNEDKLNCLDLYTLNELNRVINYFENSDCFKAAIIIGVGKKAFVSGADINEFKNIDDTNAMSFSINGQKTLQLIENSSKPILAAINGYALGGGCELAMACHLRVVSDNAKIGLPEVKLGIIPGYGGTYRLTSLIGKTKAIEYMLTGKLMTAKEALELGFANHITTHDELIDFSLNLLDEIINNSSVSVSNILKSVSNLNDSIINKEAFLFKSCFEEKDYIEGVDAFINKRKPEF